MARPSQTPYFNYLNSAYLFLAPHDGNVDDCRLFMIVYDCLSLFMIVYDCLDYWLALLSFWEGACVPDIQQGIAAFL